MPKKELGIAITAYNMVRKIMAKSAEKADFPPSDTNNPTNNKASFCPPNSVFFTFGGRFPAFFGVPCMVNN
jgi:hypothetical protein